MSDGISAFFGLVILALLEGRAGQSLRCIHHKFLTNGSGGTLYTQQHVHPKHNSRAFLILAGLCPSTRVEESARGASVQAALYISKRCGNTALKQSMTVNSCSMLHALQQTRSAHSQSPCGLLWEPEFTCGVGCTAGVGGTAPC